MVSIKIHDKGTDINVRSALTISEIEQLKKRAGTMNAALDIQSDQKGTSVILQVPIY